MSAVEIVAAALAAGAGAGLKDTASAAVADAYAELKRMLRPWVRGEARQALETDETEPGVWEARIGEELTASGAADDEEVLALARRLLAAADPEKAKSFSINVGTNHGAVGEFNAPVTFNQGQPLPPAGPAAD
ncbi:hypothetical protein AB0J83_09910 [Actinoplanes sp. NPDC049596]|uniref:hypothetical protein n=1 Tax=unclassified Actinoplanes TaxID=2626549 RepID=UPI0034346928